MFSKNKLIVLTAGIFLLGTLVGRAQETMKLTLPDALKLALQNNTNILNSKLDLEIAKKKVWETTAMGLPHADLSSAYVYLPKVPTLQGGFGGGDPNQVIELGVKNNITTDITISQLIFSGAYIVGLQATKVYYGLAEQTAEKTKLDIIEMVRNTYYVITLSDESRKILEQNLENINKTKYEISEMNKQGFVEITDVDQLELTANTVKNTLNQIESNLEMGNRLLKIYLGLEESVVIELTDKMSSDEEMIASSLELIIEPFVLDQNIDYQLIQTAEKAAQLDLKLAKSKFLPALSGYYNHTEKMNAPTFDFAPKDILGINLSFPLFSSGERLSVVSQRKMAFEKSVNTKKYVSSSLLMQANQNQDDLKLKLERYRNQKKSKELADDIYKRTLEKYKLGMASSMDLMNTQNQFLTNLTNYYQSIYEVESSKAKLEKLFNINQVVE